MTDEQDPVSPKERAHVKARERKAQRPKVIAVNPGLRNLALHLAEKRTRKTKKKV
jgi:hypothetical protein